MRWRRIGSRSDGFTLLEVIVALAIVAIALTVGMSAISYSARAGTDLEDKLYAGWVADNLKTELNSGIRVADDAAANFTERMSGLDYVSRLRNTAGVIVIETARTDRPAQVLASATVLLEQPDAAAAP